MIYMAISAILGVICIVLIGWVALLKIRAAYSRNYFSVVSLSAALSISTLSMMIISGFPFPWEVFGQISTPWGKLAFQHPPLSTSDKILIFIVPALFYIFILKMHHQWNTNQLNEAQFARRQGEQKGGSLTQTFELLADVAEAIKNRTVRQEPHNSTHAPSTSKPPIWLERRVGSDFRNSALELITLAGMPYSIDPDTGHIDTHNVWIGVNIDNNDPVCVFYFDSILDRRTAEEKMSNFSRYMKREIAGEYVFICHSDDTIDQTYDMEDGSLRILTDSSLMDNLVSFDAYATDIRNRVTRQGLHRSAQTISDVYVDLRCQIDGTAPPETIHDVLVAWARESTPHQIALLGDYGMGKSTSCLMFCHKILSRELDVRRVPILIELRGTAPSTLSQLDILAIWAGKYGINARSLMRLHEAGRLILIFEGFDEMAFSGTRESRLDHFASLWQFNIEHSKIVFTGRPNFFVYNEIRETLGMNVLEKFQPGCRPHRLLPLDGDQVKQALRWVIDDETKVGIYTKFKSDRNFRDVASRPSLLFIIASMWKDSENPNHEFKNSSQVIKNYIDFINSRQDDKRKEATGQVIDAHKFMGLRLSERMYFTRGIAVAMAEKGWSNRISAPDLHSIIRSLYDLLPRDDVFECLTVRGESQIPMRQRFSGEPVDIERIVTEVRTFGLLVQDASGKDAFQFSHKSFFEVLVAQAYVDKLMGKNTMLLVDTLDASKFTENLVAMRFAAEILVNDLTLSGKNRIPLSSILFIIAESKWLSFFTRISVVIECILIDFSSIVSKLLKNIIPIIRKTPMEPHMNIEDFIVIKSTHSDSRAILYRIISISYAIIVFLTAYFSISIQKDFDYRDIIF